MGRPRRAVLLGAAWYLAAAPAAGAQVTSALDAAISRVHYDGFLPSAAASLGGALAVQGRAATLSARASTLLFESGNTTWQASLTAAYFMPRMGPSRPELWVRAGGSRYAYFPSFWHTVAGARLHFPVERGSAWVDGGFGRTAFGDSLRPVTMAGAGLWTQRYGPTVTVAASYVRVGDTTYTDVQATARARRGDLEIDGVVGSRLWSAGGGRGVYAEAVLAVPLGGRASLVLAGGRYPTDPWRGTISGIYASAGVRLRSVAPNRRLPMPPSAPVFAAAGPSALDNHNATTSLELHPEAGGLVRLVIHAAGAATVEMVGDFTDWQPLALAATAPGLWQASLRMAPGAHRLNVRLDGGPWFVPAGATRAEDDYGGEIGIIVIP